MVSTADAEEAMLLATMPIQRLHSGPRMSQAVIHNNTVYLSGQVSHDHRGESVEVQTQEIVGRIDALLEEAGSSKSMMVSATIWVTDMRTFAEMNAVWDAWIDPANPPARACVESRLAAPGVNVEISVIAGRG